MADQLERRSQLVAEILALGKLQMAAAQDATYLGWTPEAKDAYKQRSERLGALWRESKALGAA